MALTRKRPGRKSAAARAIPATFGVTVPRHKAPVELTGEECEIFYMLTDGMPADWISTASLPLVMQLCRHSIQARRLAELLEKLAGDPDTLMSTYENLLKLQRAESAIISTLSGKLRISPSALRNDRGHLQHQPLGRAPWENALIGGAALGKE